MASFLMDANVADRSCRLYIPEVGLVGVAGTSPTSHFLTNYQITLSASQYGYIILAGPNYAFLNDNGVVTNSSNLLLSLLPLWLVEGADIQAKPATNPQVTDKSGIDVLYRKHYLED